MRSFLAPVLAVGLIATVAIAADEPARHAASASTDEVAQEGAGQDGAGQPGARDEGAGSARPVDVADVVRRLKSRAGDVRLSAANQARDVADDAVTKPLVRLLIDKEFSVRAAAIRALANRSTERGRKDASRALAARLPRLAKAKFGEGELLLAIVALGELRQPNSVKSLLDGITDETSDEVFAARMAAVGGIPHPSAIEELIQFLSRSGRRWGGRRRVVTSALQAATGQRLGNDPDKWRAWWKENRKTFDFAAAVERRAAEDAERERRAEKKAEKKKGKRKRGSK